MGRDRSGKELVLVGGERPQMRKASKRDWSKAKEKVFLSALAETCNVTRACEEAGVGVSSAYQRKKDNAAFRAAWLAHLSIAYQQLELVLLERAFNGTEKLLPAKAGDARVMREYSNQLGLALLKMHRDTALEAGREFEPQQVEEMRERLFRKLRRLKERSDRPEESSE